MKGICGGSRVLAMVLLAGLALACGPKVDEAAPSPPLLPDLKVANKGNAGQRVDLQAHLVKGKQTLFEFYSDQCPPCREMERVMEVIAGARGDLAVRRLDIDRKGHRGIDFDSPLAEQHGIDRVPFFVLYSTEGRVEARGDQAKDIVRDWYYEAQMPRDPGTERIKEGYRTPD